MAPGPSAETVSAIQDRLNGVVNSDGEIVQRRNVNKKQNAAPDNHNHEELSYADAVKKGTDDDGGAEKLDFDVELPSSHVMKLRKRRSKLLSIARHTEYILITVQWIPDPVCQDPDTTIVSFQSSHLKRYLPLSISPDMGLVLFIDTFLALLSPPYSQYKPRECHTDSFPKPIHLHIF